MGYNLEDFMIFTNEQRELFYRDFIIKEMRHLINFNSFGLLIESDITNNPSGWLLNKDLTVLHDNSTLEYTDRDDIVHIEDGILDGDWQERQSTEEEDDEFMPTPVELWIETDTGNEVDVCSPPDPELIDLKHDRLVDLLGEVLGDNSTVVVAPEGRDAIEDALDKAMKGEDTRGIKVPLLCKDGSVKPIVADVTPKRDDAGEIVGAVIKEHINSTVMNLLNFKNWN
jgi:hypothetical protein